MHIPRLHPMAGNSVAARSLFQNAASDLYFVLRIAVKQSSFKAEHVLKE